MKGKNWNEYMAKEFQMVVKLTNAGSRISLRKECLPTVGANPMYILNSMRNP